MTCINELVGRDIGEPLLFAPCKASGIDFLKEILNNGKVVLALVEGQVPATTTDQRLKPKQNYAYSALTKNEIFDLLALLLTSEDYELLEKNRYNGVLGRTYVNHFDFNVQITVNLNRAFEKASIVIDGQYSDLFTQSIHGWK